MIDERERFERAFDLFPMPDPPFDRLMRRRDRKRRNQRIAAGVLSVAVFAPIAALGIGIATRSDKFADVHGWIAYRTGSEIMAVDPANPQHTVALEPAHWADPIAWSPDGTQLLVSDGHVGDLFVVHPDGWRTYLPSARDWGSFSPDGSMVTYSTSRGIYVIGADGGSPRLVAEEESPAACGQSAAWSPDGSRIAFIDFQGPYGPTCHRSPYGVSFVNADGTGLREQLVHLPLGIGASGITWSPDGSRLAFWGDLQTLGDPVGPGQVYVINTDGSGLRQITNDGDNRWPTWSPDGSRIAFVHDGALSTMAPDGTDVQRMEGVSPEGAIAWNPLG
jgi:Tol biopolymer transport system component